MSKTRMGKRVASLLLSLVMMLSLLPTTVYAEGADTGDTTDEIVGQATTSGDNTEGTGEPEPTGEGEDGSANVTEGEDGAATNDAVVEETIAPVNAEGVDAVANAESSGDEVSGEEGNEATSFVTVNGGTTQYATLEEAIAAAEPVNGVITYTINGKVDVTATDWIQVAKAGLTGLTAVKFVGATDDAEICITGKLAILADQNYDINVSFENLTLSKLNPTNANDYGHSTEYFTTWLRNANQAENTVTYTKCTFPNGVSNNQYGKTVFDNCQFTNATGGLYNLWNYGGNTEVKNSTFTGVRGIKAYSEGTDGGSIKVAGTKFDNLTQKAAIVASKPVNVEVSNVDVTGEKGFFTRDITGKDEVQLTVAGTGISGTFEITSATDAGAAKNEFNISAGTFTSEVPNDYCADGFEVKVSTDASGNTTYGVEKAATAVAKIGEAGYDTLADAIAAAEAGQTVTLLANTTEDVIINKNITLDLGGKTLTNTSTGKATISVSNGATATVKNGSVVGGTSFYTIQNNGTATLEDVTATAGNTGSSMLDNWGTLTITSGTYTGGLDTVKSEEGSVLTINGGTFTGTYAKSNYYNGVILSAGTTTINDGEFIQSAIEPYWGCPQVVLAMQVTGYTSLVTVNGGTFTNKHSRSGAKIFHPGKGATSDNLAVKGGTFNKSVPDSYFKDGYFAKKNGSVYETVGPFDAKIGTTGYATLEAAFAAAKSGNTITLLRDCSGNGIVVGENRFTGKGLTVDFAGHTYTVGGVLVGSATTGTNAFQLLQGNKITFKNGTIAGVAENTKPAEDTPNWHGAPAIVIQNYCDLTLKNMTVSGGDETVYTMSNNCGNVVIENTTINAGKAKGFTSPAVAFDVCRYSSYPSVTVTVKGNSVINGDVEVSGTIGEGQSRQLYVTGGKFTGEFKVSGNVPANITVSGGTFTSAVPAEYCADGFIPTKNADGTYGVKNGSYVAETNDVKYESLAEAITAAESGATVTLLADCASDRINLEKSITVDLNGKVLTSTAEYGVMFCAKNGKTITINGTTEGSKLVGTLMVTNGTYGHIVINGGTYESDKYCPIYINGAVSTDDSTLTVTNATIKALAGNSDQDNGVGVYLAGYSTSIFTNTTIAAPVTGLEIRAGKLTLTDCNVTGGNDAVAAKADGSGSTVANAAVAISQHTTKKNIDVTINGGTYTATAAVYQTDVQGTGSEGVKANIKAGTFNGTVSAETNNTVAVSGGSFSSAVPKNCCAAGYIPVANDGGTHGVKGPFVAKIDSEGYATLQAAIDAATRNQTVTMLANTEENVTIAKALTLDLNGFTLNGGTVAGTPTLKIDTARVTVMDSSEAKTGTIMREDTAENSGVSSHYVIDIQGKNALLIFNSGNVRNNSGNTEGKGASLVRVGDDNNKKAHPVLTIAGGTFTQDNFIVIKVDFGTLHLKGGTVNSKTSYAVENWLNANIKGDAVVNGAVSSWTYSTGSNSTLEISGGTINGNIESVSYDGAAGKKASVSITGGVVNGMLSTHIYNKETEPSKDIATIEVTGGTFSSDPTKYLVECSTVTPNADGTFGVKKAYLAKVGNTSYYTMEEAFKAQTASGEPIVMLRDYTTGSSFWSGSIDRTVELGGHTWTCTGTDANSAAFKINYPNASLTVKNGKIVSSQLVGLIPSASGGTYTYDNSSLTFENVKMSTTATSGIETNGNNTNDTVTLKDSTLDVPNGFGIYFPSSGKLTIDNSTITAKTMGVQVCAGSLSINAGSAITVSGDAVSKTENDGAIQDGAAISIVNRTGYKGLGNVTVTGGTFKANGTNAAIKAYKWENQTASAFDNSKNVVAVSGGTFSSAVPEGLCAEGYISVANANGTHTVKEGVYVAQVGSTKYESLAAAIGAAQDSDTVTLLKDIDLPATAVVKGKTITLDLNGKTISNSTDIWNESKYAWSLISVRDNGDLTINDTTGGGTLKAKENDCFALDVYAYDTKNVEDTKLTINAGNYVGNISAVYAFTGKATINGGHFSIQQKESGSDPYRLTLNCYDSSYTAGRAGFTVNGGTFENFDPRNNPAEGAGTSFVAEGVGVNNENGNFTAVPNMAAQRIAADGSSVEAYATLADAIAAAQDGQTVMLLADVNGNVEIAAGKNLTLDLNGKILNGGTVTGKAALTNYGTITIKDSSEEKTGTIKRDDNGTAGYYVIRNQGKMTIESGTVTNNSGYAKANSTGSMIGSSLICNGDCDGVPTLTIQGGTFTQDNFIAIKNGALGVLHVTGGTITSKHSAIQNWFKADITGGEITGQLWTDAYMVGESVGVTTIGGDAKFTGEIVMDIYGSVAPTLAITGGNLEVTKWNITKAAANVGAKPAVSGGTFSSKVPAEYCAPGYVPTGEGADGRFTVAEGEFIVQVTSRTVSSNTHVANVSGGGSNITYAVGTTVTAASLSGYKFVGWFVNEYTGTPYSTDLTCKVKPTDDCTMIAVYKPVEGGIFELTVNASKFTVNDGAVQTSYLLEKIDVGASVTVKFKGTEKFLYWVNESKKVVSTNPEYTFYMGSATTLNAVYAEKQENQAMVVFVSLSGQVISSKSYTDKQPITFPEPPIKMGATFEKWSMTEAQIRAAMATTETGIIIVEPVYVSNETEATVTITYPDQTTDTKTGTVGKVITLTAKSIEGKEFKCWKYDGMTLGYTETLKVAPRGTMNLEAVYVTAGEPVTRTPVIELTEISASKLDEKYVVSFTATRSVPENYTVIGQGVLASTNSRYAEKDALEAMKLDSKGNPPAGVFKYADEGTDSIGVTVANGKTSYADRVVYGRAYMILKNTKTGATEYYYGSEILSNSYNGLTSNGGN